MKNGNALAIGLLALALAACGGHGGHSSGTTTAPVGLTTDYRVEAVLTDTTKDPDFPYQDPLNLQTADNVTFQLVYYTGSGSSVVRHVVPGVTFSTNDTTLTAGTLSAGDGVFQASGADTGNRQYILSAQYRGQSYSTFYRINPRQIRLRGRIVAEGTGLPVYNATIDFYANRNPSDTNTARVVIATVRTASDGTFRASIPSFNDSVDTVAEAAVAPIVTFTVRGSALPDGFYPSYLFKGVRFDAGSTVCQATLLSGDTVTDPDTGETQPLPFKSGDRTLIGEGDVSSNGTIQLTPTTAYSSKPSPDGCSL